MKKSTSTKGTDKNPGANKPKKGKSYKPGGKPNC